MKLFIWHNIDDVTDYFHTSGGLVVVAEDLAAARASLSDLPKDCQAHRADPDYTYELANGRGPNVIVFPDSGCC